MRRTLILGAIAALVLASCGDAPDRAADAEPASDCPVTIPDGAFTPPDDHPATPGIEGHVWFGSADLWTELPVDGSYEIRKSVWWSTAFPGGADEENPPISVTYTSLDTGEVHRHDDGTNAYTPETGWFMIAGIDPEEPGCWQVEATYKGATLSYVFRSPESVVRSP